jgi:hypothetical protein
MSRGAVTCPLKEQPRAAVPHFFLVPLAPGQKIYLQVWKENHLARQVG